MKHRSLIFAAIFGALGLVACDEGDIQEQQNQFQNSRKVALLTTHISGRDSWPSQYNVVLASFAENSNYAISQSTLPEDIGTDLFQMTMDLADENISTVELCITNRLRQRVATFLEQPLSNIQGDTLRLSAETVNLGMFQTIQDMVFTPTCARCHGLGNTPAAGLNLSEGKSYESLVNHVSSKEERGMRVVAGDAASSLLHKVINGDPSGVSFNHSNMIKESSTLALIDHWISAGANP